jgi:hypothetical protein
MKKGRRGQDSAKGQTSAPTVARLRRSDGGPSIGWKRSMKRGAELRSQAGSANVISPMAAEVIDHLMKARVGLECLAIDQSGLSCGPAFPHFEEASRSVHSALIALEGCLEASGEPSWRHGQVPGTSFD